VCSPLQTIEFLLQSEANPNIANGEGLTPAHLARSSGALQLLYNHQAEIHCIDNRYASTEAPAISLWPCWTQQ
jgi:hypothetical protein